LKSTRSRTLKYICQITCTLKYNFQKKYAVRPLKVVPGLGSMTYRLGHKLWCTHVFHPILLILAPYNSRLILPPHVRFSAKLFIHRSTGLGQTLNINYGLAHFCHNVFSSSKRLNWVSQFFSTPPERAHQELSFHVWQMLFS
jgi:hypothetical protein